MEYKYSFEKLEVWKCARDLALKIYKLSDQLPTDEKYGLTSQIRRCATSVLANIAEGSTRFSRKSQNNFYQIAFGSLIELYNHLILARDLELIKESDEILKLIKKVSNQLNSLIKSTNKRINKSTI